MNLSSLIVAVVAVLSVSTVPLIAASDDEDRKAIETAALDYAQGWYSGDRSRMASSLHEALTKRAYLPNKDGQRMLSDMDKATLLEGNQPGNREHYRDAPKRAEVTVLDRFGDAASVRLHMDGWVDYLHVVRDLDGEWRIINVLWELEPTS